MAGHLSARLGAAFLVAFAPHALSAQSASAVPNYGNYRALDDAFRIGVQVTNALNGFSQEASFEQRTIDDILDYIDPFELAQVVGAQNAQFGAVSAVYDLRGATALAGYAQNSQALTIRFVSPTGETVNLSDGTPCTFNYTGATRQDSFNQFDEATEDFDEGASNQSATSRLVQRCIARSLSRYSPIDPLAGNPGSLQGSMVRNALDLTNGDSLVEQGPNTSGDPWIVGASYSTGSAGRFDIDRADGRIQRSFRLFEGNRGLLKFDLPFSYTRGAGTKAYSAQIGVGLETIVIPQRWSIEPRVAYGVAYSGDAGSAGNILQGTLTSRYVIQGLGRGRLVVGNMVGYSKTLDLPAVDIDINPSLANWSFRNGLAYELPLKARLGGRLSSLRASYNFTLFAGDDLRNNSFHEASLSFGLRGREESVRATRDLIRFNLNTVLAKGYKTFTAGAGFRF